MKRRGVQLLVFGFVLCLLGQFLARGSLAGPQGAGEEPTAYRDHLVAVARQATSGDPDGTRLVDAFEAALKNGTVPLIIVHLKEGVDAPRPTPFSYEPGGFVYIDNLGWQETDLGPVIMHHLTHWAEGVTHDARHTEDGDGQLYGEELRAHAAERSALDRVTGHRYDAAVERVLADPHLAESRHNMYFRLPTEAGANVLAGVWQGEVSLSLEEVHWRGKMGMTDVLLPQCQTSEQMAQAFYAIDSVFEFDAGGRR